METNDSVETSNAASSSSRHRLAKGYLDEHQCNGKPSKWPRQPWPRVSRTKISLWGENLANYLFSSNGFYTGSREEFFSDVEEIDIVRLREVTGKAISGALLLLLKWFKRSRKPRTFPD
jgi:Domain of unknown function (DUF3402)